MRSALGYMVKRGLLAGIGIIAMISILSSLLSTSGFQQVVIESAGNNLIFAALFYLLVALTTGVIVGSIPGILIGMLNGWYINHFVRQRYGQIIDEADYAAQLGLRTAGLTLALTLSALVLFSNGISTELNILTVILAGIAGGLTGRGYAYYDMAQRREKKHTLEAESNLNAAAYQAKQRLALAVPNAEKADHLPLLDEASYNQLQQRS